MKANCHQCNKIFTLTKEQEYKIKNQGDCARLFCSKKCTIKWTKEKRSFRLNEKIKFNADD
jgi:hypothetical protein